MLMHTRHSGGQREKGPPACASPLASIGPRVLRVHLFLETHPDPLWECLSQRGAPPQTQLHGAGLEPRPGRRWRKAAVPAGREGWLCTHRRLTGPLSQQQLGAVNCVL